MSLNETFFRAAGSAAVSWLGVPGSRAIFFGLTAMLTLAITVVFALSMTEWTPFTVVTMPLVALNAAWISGGAATAIIGLLRPLPNTVAIPENWVPEGQTAILVTLCKEEPHALSRYLKDLHASLGRAGLADRTSIFVLSDTSGTEPVAQEQEALRDLVAEGILQYRRRTENVGRKPGNIADWLRQFGDSFDYMLVLDADSRMSAGRIRRMIRQIEHRPRTGLLQAGMALVPGQTRFGRHQRVAVRLMSSNFGHGMAAWAGQSSNYWGHNAIIRVEAFRTAAELPSLPGRAPFGGPLLSHDFIEAAWIRKAGWAIELDPDLAGSAEDGPQTLEEFHKRDRRWCQGNLQHLFVLGKSGLHPMSRFHLASGVVSYLTAPIWLILVILIASGTAPVTGALPFTLIVSVLLVPKLCALAGRITRDRTMRRKLVTIRAWTSELAISTLIAPITMIRQTASVGSVLIGRDCGWKSGGTPRWSIPCGAPEAAAGLTIMLIAALSESGATLWLAPLILPLLGAPLIVRALDARPT